MIKITPLHDIKNDTKRRALLVFWALCLVPGLFLVSVYGLLRDIVAGLYRHTVRAPLVYAWESLGVIGKTFETVVEWYREDVPALWRSSDV